MAGSLQNAILHILVTIGLLLTWWFAPHAKAEVITVSQQERITADSHPVLDRISTQYSGKIIYLDLWASWCGPCRLSFPFMQRMQEKYGKYGFQIIAVNVDKNAVEADRFLKRANKEAPINFEIMFDPSAKLAELLEIQSMPTSLLIDSTGAIRAVHKGFRQSSELTIEQEIRHLLQLDS